MEGKGRGRDGIGSDGMEWKRYVLYVMVEDGTGRDGMEKSGKI